MAEQPKGELVVVGFNYDLLNAQIAERVRSRVERIREKVKKTLESIIEIGKDLQEIKQDLEHGQFEPWLKAEFGWAERTARNFMAVAEQFGKSAIIADLPIVPTAAYLLAAPSVSDKARKTAIERAEGGEEITVATAKEIVAAAKKKRPPRRVKPLPTDNLSQQLVTVLEQYRDQWNQMELEELARHLREFAAKLEVQDRDGREGRKK